jgi:hypothetical protein
VELRDESLPARVSSDLVRIQEMSQAAPAEVFDVSVMMVNRRLNRGPAGAGRLAQGPVPCEEEPAAS